MELTPLLTWKYLWKWLCLSTVTFSECYLYISHLQLNLFLWLIIYANAWLLFKSKTEVFFEQVTYLYQNCGLKAFRAKYTVFLEPCWKEFYFFMSSPALPKVHLVFAISCLRLESGILCLKQLNMLNWLSFD